MYLKLTHALQDIGKCLFEVAESWKLQAMAWKGIVYC